MDPIPDTASAEMNVALSKEFTKTEDKAVLKQMESLKAPPDGLPPLFLQHYWQQVGEEVFTAVLHFLNLGSIPPCINHAYITLIPKVKSPIRVSEYRPIYLCNIICKLISKVVANRLKKILPHLVSKI